MEAVGNRLSKLGTMDQSLFQKDQNTHGKKSTLKMDGASSENTHPSPMKEKETRPIIQPKGASFWPDDWYTLE